MMGQLWDDFQRLWRTLHTFNDAPEGTTRIALTETDRRSRQWLKTLWEDRGLSTTIDGVGNVIGLLGSPPYVLLGSHTDTVPHGGSYDGILGVIAATVVATQWTARDQGLMLVDWSCEESSRFGISTLGSRLAVGEYRSTNFQAVDRAGMVLADALRDAYGYPGVPIAEVTCYPIKAALELHMEQGDELAARQAPVAIVTAIAAPQRWQVTVQGEANHSAATAMGRRLDALAALAELTLAIEALSRDFEAQGLRSTVTDITVSPGAANVIAGQATGLIDVRAQSRAVLDRYRQSLDGVCREIATRRGVHLDLSELSGEEPGNLDPAMMTCMEQVLTQHGIAPLRVPSWPSHDSLPLSRHLPVAMLFVRNPTGVSHNARESLNESDIDLALEVFYDVIVAIHQHPGGEPPCSS